jgi:acid phosphatase type 7
MLKVITLATLLFGALLGFACRTPPSSSEVRAGTPIISSTVVSPPTATVTISTTLGATTVVTAGITDLPIRAAFYYAWYPDAWTRQTVTPYSHYTPTLGFYNSSNIQTIQHHITAMQYGQIEAGIVSWWGQGHHTDGRIPALLSAAQGSNFRWTLYYEAEGQGDPTVEQIGADLAYLQERYGEHPNYLKLDGRMVLFVFANTSDGEDGCEMVERWREANTVNAYIVLKVFRGFRDCPTQPDGWHQYAPSVAESWQRGYSFSISPGFWVADAEQPRLPRDLNQWRQSIQAMVASGEPFQLITSFNEWNEGTAVESATAWQSDSTFGQYLDALHDNGAGASDNGGTSERPVWPTPMPTPTPSVVMTLTAAADTYISQENPTTDYGSATALRTDVTPTIRSYLRFDLPALPEPIRRARLHLFVNSQVALGYEVRTLTTTTWSETELVFDNAPPPGYVVGTSGPVEQQNWSVVDVTNGITTGSTESGSVGFVLANLNNSAISYASRETVTPPTLVLELGATTEPTITTGVTATAVYAVGDIADCTSEGDDATAALLDAHEGPIFTLGDTVYMSGTVQQFAECFDLVWGRHKARIRPAVGNHEYITPDAAPYYAYFGSAAGDPAKGYYSYDLGAWHVVVLNSNCSEINGCEKNSTQEQWLRADLAAHPTHCTVAYMHHPRWSSGKYGENDRVQPLVETLYEYGVDLLLAGHAHQYERYALQDPNGNRDDTYGIRQIVVGTGGKNHTPILKVLPNSEVRNDDTFGVLKLLLYPDRYSWEFLPVAGGAFTDRGSEGCR